MKALKQKQEVAASLPSQASSRLIGHDGPIQDVCFTAEGKYCLTAGYDRTVRLWNPARLDPAHVPPPSPLPSKHRSNDHDDDIPINQLPRALPIQSYTHVHSVAAIAVDPNCLLAASGNSVVVTDLVTARSLRTLTGHTGIVNAVVMTPELYLSASYDGTVRIWDAKSRNTIQTMKEAKDSVTSIMVHANNIITGSVDGMMRTYNVQSGQLHADNVGSPVVSMDMSKDGLCVVVATLDGDLIFMDAGTGQLLNTYERTHRAGKYALQCCVTANDASILTGSEDGRAVLYDVVQGTMVQSLEGHLRPTCAVAAHPKRSDVVVTASYDGTAVVWAHEASSFMHMNVD